MGFLIERLIIRHLYNRLLDTILATWGIGVLLQQLIRLTVGSELKYLKIPPFMAESMNLFGQEVSIYRVFIFLFAVAIFFLAWFIIYKTSFGIKLRAVTQNRSMSECLGISTKKVDTITFGIGSGLAGVAGVAVSLLGSVGPDVGQLYIVPCFMVVVLGGVGNILGTVLASFGIGILTDIFASGRLLTLFPNAPSFVFNTLSFFSTSSMAVVLIFSLIVIFLQFKPKGLFPQKGRTVE